VGVKSRAALDQPDGVAVWVRDQGHAQGGQPVVGLGEHAPSGRHESGDGCVRVISPEEDLRPATGLAQVEIEPAVRDGRGAAAIRS
jgi:hypothetical protein